MFPDHQFSHICPRVGGGNKTRAPRPVSQYLTRAREEGEKDCSEEEAALCISWGLFLKKYASNVHFFPLPIDIVEASIRRETHSKPLNPGEWEILTHRSCPQIFQQCFMRPVMYSINLQGTGGRACKNAEKVRPSHHNYYQKFIGYFQC